MFGVLAPHRRVVGRLAELGDAEVRVLTLRPPLEDAHQHRGDADGDQGPCDEEHPGHQEPAVLLLLGLHLDHLMCPTSAWHWRQSIRVLWAPTVVANLRGSEMSSTRLPWQ